MGFFHLSLFVILGTFPAALLAQGVMYSSIAVNVTETIAETDENFVCATIDWWPHDKCNYNRCPWGYSSAINLNLSNPFLGRAIQAFKNLRIRIGGSLQDQVVYDVGKLKVPCHPFQKINNGLFGYSKGCLHMKRWDELNCLFRNNRVVVTFGLNALFGRHRIRQDAWGGDWDSSNARDFIRYTISKGYPVDSWEFGNELSGSGIGASVAAEQYGKDLIALRKVIDELYENSHVKPLLIAPGGFFDEGWYTKLLQVSGPGVINVMTHHIYNLGAGIDPNLVSKILSPLYLSEISKTFSDLQETIRKHGPWSSAWVGESGGAYNSGGRHVSNTFVNSFWYLDQLGMASKHNTKVYCRQSLIGGNYGLLNWSTSLPNPDYYSALLWHRLMGKGVLTVESNAPSHLRSYAHCSKGRAGVTLLLINLNNETNFITRVHNNNVKSLVVEKQPSTEEGTILIRGLKKTVSFVGTRSSKAAPLFREEYHLTPKDGYLRSQVMLLNGTPLEVTEDGEIPTLKPAFAHVNSLVSVAPLSMAFIVLPSMYAPACA
ncbi:heparanase-like protein 1 [Punica granatum]|uniref:Heparanase-like protein 1 n=1 Tax=Punica granatum TaxID=22663 RepID=A0A6P8EHN5_PUNGR|nr:heparanase-like protein 1 [Punica granatum]XP_031406240.1 heparanase-like protein 1 [Punica granatum]